MARNITGEELLAKLQAERAELDIAIRQLTRAMSKTGASGTTPQVANSTGKGKRHLSAASRKKLSEAAKKRWAKAKRG
ncbi:MAG TPA: hypothetical protein VN577_10210 [Terriglobales bacterium]|nr:hypothetical protein [Terriglobales bacterium]